VQPERQNGRAVGNAGVIMSAYGELEWHMLRRPRRQEEVARGALRRRDSEGMVQCVAKAVQAFMEEIALSRVCMVSPPGPT